MMMMMMVMMMMMIWWLRFMVNGDYIVNLVVGRPHVTFICIFYHFGTGTF